MKFDGKQNAYENISQIFAIRIRLYSFYSKKEYQINFYNTRIHFYLTNHALMTSAVINVRAGIFC